MQRHIFGPLFEPQSILVITDQQLPLAQSLPAAEHPKLTKVQVQKGRPIEIPSELAGATAEQRLDLAVLCVDPARLAETLDQLAKYRPRAAILLQSERVDSRPEQTITLCRRWATLHGCLMIGPQSFGILRPHLGLNLSLNPTLAREGRVAFVAQSSAIVSSVLDWADETHIGFSSVVALGDETVARLAGILEYLATDSRTDSIALYVEEIGFGREFMSALRAAASVKPVVVLKAGRAFGSPQEDAAFDAALRRAGAVRVRYFVNLFSALKVLVHLRRPTGRRLAVMANGDGPSQLAMDLAIDGVPFASADFAVQTRMALSQLLEPGKSVFNPVITNQPLTRQLTRDLLHAVLNDTGVDGVLVLLSPDSRADLSAVVDELALIAPGVHKPIITCLMGDAHMRPLRRLLDDAGTPAFRTPESAADAFGVLATYHYNQQLLLQLQSPHPDGRAPDLHLARNILVKVREQGRTRLAAPEMLSLIEAFNVPLALRSTVNDIVLRQQIPLRVEVHLDLHFGPIVSVGVGGAIARIIGPDAGTDLAPLNPYLARLLLDRSRVWRHSLAGHVSQIAHEALLTVLEQVSIMVAELPDIERIVFDPIYFDDLAPFALDASIALRALPQRSDPQMQGYPHMAIHPYPYRWVESLEFGNEREGTLRPIRPEDAQALQNFIRGLSDRSRYMRFVSMMRELTPRMIARYTQIDYHRELALVVTTSEPDPADRGRKKDVVIGLAHYLRNPDGRGAEYALVVGDDWQRLGLGGRLMRKLILAAQEQGLDYIEGMVLSDNRPMISLMTKLGFTVDHEPDDPGTRRIWLNLVNRTKDSS
jgi:acetyltransferase